MKLRVKLIESLKRNAMVAQIDPTSPDLEAWIYVIGSIDVTKHGFKYIVYHLEFDVKRVELARKHDELLDIDLATNKTDYKPKSDEELQQILAKWFSDSEELLPPWRVDKPF